MDKTHQVSESSQIIGQLGKYRLECKLGEGGFGAVYKAFDPDLQVYRAIKIPTIQGDDAGDILKEARLQAQFTHPNIIQVHSVEQIDGRWAIIMEYLVGGNLRDKMNVSCPIPLDEALDCIEKVAYGLKAAHTKNILHHDIKPENILFDSTGVPKLADFGIARVFQESQKDMSRVMGTVAYMAPEQLEGRADLRSDIWSLGVMLYEMLSGKPCFGGKSQAEVVKNIVMGKPVPLCSVNKDIPEAVERIVMRMIEKNSKARFQNMDDVIQSIETYRDGVWIKKRKPLWVIIPIMTTVLFGVFGLYYGVYAGIFDNLELPFMKDQAAQIPVVEIPKDVLAQKYEAQIDKADSFIQKKNFALAYHVLGNIIDHTKDENVKAQARLSRGLLLSEDMNLPDLALNDYLAIIQADPNSTNAASAHYFAGWVYYEKKKDLKRAIYHLTTVMNQFPDSPSAQTAQFLVQDAAKRLEMEGPDVGLVMQSFVGRFLPNNALSLFMSVLSLITLISATLASLLIGYHKKYTFSPEDSASPFKLLKAIMSTPGLKYLVIVIITCQIVSFLITNYKSKTEYTEMAQALKKSGVVVQMQGK